jgi:5-methylcytosine-specific restriction endonuclease McrA
MLTKMIDQNWNEIRKLVFHKYDGLCAYSGKSLEADWQIDHHFPIRRSTSSGIAFHRDRNNIHNLLPCQKLINHHKSNLNPERYKQIKLKHLHKVLKNLPRHPRSTKQIRKKEYYIKIASYFDIQYNKPFDMIFYYEMLAQD